VKPSRAWDRLAQVLALLMVLVCGSAPSSPIGARTFPSASNPYTARAQELSPEGQTWLRAATSSGYFAEWDNVLVPEQNLCDWFHRFFSHDYVRRCRVGEIDRVLAYPRTYLVNA
jgi:hypothetical protein